MSCREFESACENMLGIDSAADTSSPAIVECYIGSTGIRTFTGSGQASSETCAEGSGKR